MDNPFVMGYSMLIGHLRVKLKKMRPAAGRFVRLNPLHFQRLGAFSGWYPFVWYHYSF